MILNCNNQNDNTGFKLILYIKVSNHNNMLLFKLRKSETGEKFKI